jgi:hypothetical protein
MGNPFYRNFGIADAKFQKATTVTACTFTDSGDLVTASSHGLSDGWTVVLQTIVTTTGASVNVRYYVISSTSSTFQLAATVGGSAIALTTNGTGTYIAIKEYDVYLANSADINVKSKGLRMLAMIPNLIARRFLATPSSYRLIVCRWRLTWRCSV